MVHHDDRKGPFGEQNRILRVLLDRRMLICVATGFASGLPLFVVMQLVPAWLRLEGVSLTAIGLFTAVQYPYVLKFLWAPVVERYPLTSLGRRRSWMLATQIALIFSIGSLGFWQPNDAMMAVVIISIGLAFFGATQDIVLDAYRREILETDGELALGNTVHVQAYRIAGLVPGTLGMILAGSIGWDLNFMIMASFMSVGVILALVIGEPKNSAEPPPSLWRATVIPFQEFFQRRALGPTMAVLAFIVLYKLGDNMATALATPFYLDMGFSTETIGVVAKGVSLWAVIIGGVIGAFVVARIGINRSLWTFGVVQMITILGFVWLSQAGADVWVLGVVIAGEYIGVGLGTTASVAFIARETSRLAVATQFAMFTALASLPRVVAASFSGLIVDSIGWTEFFYFSTLLAIPGMLLLFWVAPFNSPYNLQQDSPGNGEGRGQS